MEYNTLLNKKDKIIKLPNTIRVDLKDFVDMSTRCLPIGVKWHYIQNIKFTAMGMTLYYLALKHKVKLDEEKGYMTIDNLYPPASLIQWVYEQTK